jgi:DNA ligase-1
MKVLNSFRWISEKIDGIRIIWDGIDKIYLRKSQKQIIVPKFFTENLPKTPLEGELW